MEFKAVTEKDIPHKYTNNREKIKILEDFLASNEKLVELLFDSNSDGRKTARALYQLTYHYNFPIKVMQRDSKIFLERTDL